MEAKELEYYKKRTEELEKEKADNDQMGGCLWLILAFIGFVTILFIG